MLPIGDKLTTLTYDFLRSRGMTILDSMSDIFISYSKSDHALAAKLSAFLESEGWTVWWDKSLGAADLYRDEIMKQLVAARAVITIWSADSIKSDWVRAEAARAKAEGKLIPVKTPELTYGDIPLPFGEMHTENVASTDLIRAAIVAQLSKPSIPKSPFWQIEKMFEYNVLTWIGIIGSAITVYGNLGSVLDLADWAKELITHWHELTQIVWGWVFGWFGIKVPKQLIPVMSFTAFATMLVIGVNLSSRAKPRSGRSMKPRITRMPIKIGYYVIGVLLLSLIASMSQSGVPLWLDPSFLAFWAIGVIGSTVAVLLYSVKERILVLVASLLFAIMGACLLVLPTMHSANDETSIVTLATSFSLFQFCWMGVILFSPLQQLTRRLSFVVLGVLTLVALNEVSKLDLRRYLQPPKASDNALPLAAQISLCGIPICASTR